MGKRKLQKAVNHIMVAIASPTEFSVQQVETILQKPSFTNEEIKSILHSYGQSLHLNLLMTPLQYAAYIGNENVVRHLLEVYTVDVNQIQDIFISNVVLCPGVKHTALSYAVKQQNMPIVELLVSKYKADVNISQKNSPRPLDVAVYYKNYDLVQYLVENGACLLEGETQSTDSTSTGFILNGISPLTTAIEVKSKEIVEYLIEKNMDVNSVDQYGNSALHRAAKTGAMAIARLLFQHGALYKENKFGLTPLHIACLHENLDMIDFLTQYLEATDDLTVQEKCTVIKLISATRQVNGNGVIPPAQMFPGIGINEMMYPELATDFDMITNYNLDMHGIYVVQEPTFAVYEDLLGQNNPYVALALDVAIEEHIHSRTYDQALHYIRKQLNILKRLQQPTNLTSVWIHLSYMLSELPQMACHSVIRELYHNTMSCAKVFLSENVWRDRDPYNWFDNFQCKIPTNNNDMIVKKILMVLFHLINMLPANAKDQIHKVKVLAIQFVNISQELTTQGIARYSALHALFIMDEWRSTLPESVANTVHKLVNFLVICGANPNARDADFNTPLHYMAASISHPHCSNELLFTKMLLNQGAYLNSRNIDGLTPYELFSADAFGLSQEEKSARNYEHFKSILYPGHVVSLKCLSANVLRDEKVQYKNELFSTLCEYTDMH